MGLNSHMAYFTLNPSDMPNVRDQTELVRLFAVPLTHSVVFYSLRDVERRPVLL